MFVGDDWAEDHHDLELVDAAGRRLTRARLSGGVAGIARLYELLAAHLPEDAEPDQVVVGIETDRGPWVQALLAAGYQVYADGRVMAFTQVSNSAATSSCGGRTAGQGGYGTQAPHSAQVRVVWMKGDEALPGWPLMVGG